MLTLFVYEEGRDFVLSARAGAFAGSRRLIPLLAPEVAEPGYRVTDDPDAADFLVFPYNLESIVYTERALAASAFIRSLPYYHTHEAKHVFFNFHDRNQPLMTDALVVTNDPDRGNRGDSRIVTFPHAPGAHVCAAAPNFAFRSIKYDTSYVGTLSFPVRLTMAESVRRQQHLRYFLQHPNTLDWQDPQSSYLHMNDQEKKRALERLYVEKMAQSWTTLCPRGMGSSSIRFFETLCMGRIPVHISDAYILPRQEEIDYASFCLLLPESEAEHTGEILDEWLSGKSLEERAALCLTARKVWERYFRPEHFRQYALALLERNKPSQGAPTKPRRYVLGRHEWRGATGPKPYYTPDAFAHMELDDRRLWIVRGLEVGRTADGTVTVNGLPSRLAPSELTFLTEFASAQDVNAVLVSLAPTCATGVIALANGLFLGRKLNATLYVAVAGDLPPWRRDLDNAGVDYGIRLIALAPGETPADVLGRFQPGSVHAVILESGDMDLADATPACLRPHGVVLQRNRSGHGFRLRPASPERLTERLFASVAMTTPFPGAFRPGRVMLGMLPPGDWPKVIPFVRSLRASGYTGETVLFTIDADPAAQRFLAANGCHGITAAVQPNFRHVPAQCLRYFLYRTFLHQFGDAFDGVFLTDVDDVVVQGDVFAHLAPGCLTLFGTDGPVRERPGDAAWIRDLYGPDMLAAMGDSPAVCSGTILGAPALVTDYLQRMTEHLQPVPVRLSDREDGDGADQGVGNVLLRRGLMPPCRVLANADAAVFTYDGPCAMLPDGRLATPDGRPFAVVHYGSDQPELARRLLDRLGPDGREPAPQA